MTILSLNAGSSSVKYTLFAADATQVLAGGEATRVGTHAGEVRHDDLAGVPPERELALPDHRAAVDALLADLAEAGRLDGRDPVSAVGHRVVHGGDRFTDPVIVDGGVLAGIRELAGLAPLHNAASAECIEVARHRLPGATHVAVFDTAFHASMPARARRYALPDRYGADGFRRYGFHGISHGSVAHAAADLLDRPLASLSLVTLHLGQGASVAAIQGGRSIDTSMGMTPLEGLVMGTRCGDLDPGVVVRLLEEAGSSASDIDHLLNRESGLLALSGSSDMRDIEAAAAQGDARSREAIEIFCYRARKYVGAYWAALGQLDGVVFTGGIGEHSARVRAGICEGLEGLGIAVDAEANGAHAGRIDAGRVPVLVLPADEQRAIARATAERLHEAGSGAGSAP